MMRRLLPCTLAGLVALGLGGGSARAETRASVLGVEAVDAPAELASKLREALVTQVRQAPGFSLLAGKSLEEIKLVFGCVDEKPDCMSRVGRSLGAGKLVWGTLKKSATGYHLTIKYLDVPTASIEKFVSENVAAGALEGPGAQSVVERLTRSFLPSGRAGLRISSNVEGAAVVVGGKAIGVTVPGGLLLRDLMPGRVEVQVSKPGYLSWSQSVVVSPGETAYVDAQLEATLVVPPAATQPAPPPPLLPGPSRRTGWKAAFWTSAAVTVSLGAGIVGTGMTVLNQQKDKEAAVKEATPTFSQYVAAQVAMQPEPAREAKLKALQAQFHDDVCQVARDAGAATVVQTCDSGEKWATATNILVGLTAAAALATGFFYYKAYLQKDPEEPPATETVTRRRDQPRVEWMVAPSVGPKGGGLGLHLQF